MCCISTTATPNGSFMALSLAHYPEPWVATMTVLFLLWRTRIALKVGFLRVVSWCMYNAIYNIYYLS
jgi:hypothetical protein